VIEPLFEDGRLIGEVLHFYTPRVEDFFIVSEVRRAGGHPEVGHNNAFGGGIGWSFEGWFGDRVPPSQGEMPVGLRPIRQYDATGNFLFDSHVYPFPYLHRISAAEFNAGLTAALWLEGYRVVNGAVVAPGGATAPPVTPDPPVTSPIINEISVYLNGRRLNFEVAPQMINGRTMLPLRAIFEEMGAEVEWNPQTQTATATRGNITVILSVGSLSPTVNGVAQPIDQAGVIIDGRTLAPLRFVAEAFGGEVEWDNATRTATITTN
jgi:hypothetical protein